MRLDTPARLRDALTESIDKIRGYMEYLYSEESLVDEDIHSKTVRQLAQEYVWATDLANRLRGANERAVFKRNPLAFISGDDQVELMSAGMYFDHHQLNPRSLASGTAVLTPVKTTAAPTPSIATTTTTPTPTNSKTA